MDFNEWLTAKGFDASTISDTQRTTLESAWRADTDTSVEEEQPAPPPAAPAATTPNALDRIISEQRLENARREEITRLVSKSLAANPVTVDAVEQIGQTALEKGWTVQQTELELLRTVRSNHPGLAIIRDTDKGEMSGKVIEAAFCMGAGLTDVEKQFDERTLNAAHRQFKNGIGLAEMVMIVARQKGYRGQSYNIKSNMRTILEYASGKHDSTNFRAGPSGPSTYTTPQILSSTANKFLGSGFRSVDPAWSDLCSKRSVNDFKQTTTLALTGATQYQEVPRGGEIKHGSVGERYYNNQANTYGVLIGIDRRDLINDDAGAFGSLSFHMGRGAGLKINDIFWTVFLNNTGSFFTSGNANVSTGGGSALSTADGAAINAAEQKFYAQTDPDGKPLGIMPKIMLVPPTLVNTAARWMGSQLMIGSTALGDANVYAGRYRVITSPYMENTSYTGYSTAAWYLLADPAVMPVIEGAFLNGQQTPTVETGDFDWNTLGLSMRGWLDFGFSLQEYRGGVRSAGS